MKRPRRLKPDDLDYLTTVQRLFLTEPVDPKTLDQGAACRDGENHDGPALVWKVASGDQAGRRVVAIIRPTGQPTHGLTRNRSVVELPRRASDEREDPVLKVSGPGWPTWFPVEPSDEVVHARRGPPRATHHAEDARKQKHRGGDRGVSKGRRLN